MGEKTSMFELLKERLTEEEIIKITCDYDLKFCELEEENKQLKSQLQQKGNIIKEAREKVNNFDVFKEFTFPLMKRWEEEQVKSSIDYEWRKSIKQPILEILDKGE
ncbi:MAG: hypothetical protein IKQ33_01760 [Clostridia bacterium]|nr:hypothetical protein [Clostridia bacterium]